MALVVVTLKVMPESPETSLKRLENNVKKKILRFIRKGEIRVEEDPIGFGLSALKFIFAYEEEKGSTDKLEENIEKIGGVQSVQVVDVRRAIG